MKIKTVEIIIPEDIRVGKIRVGNKLYKSRILYLDSMMPKLYVFGEVATTFHAKPYWRLYNS
jgi:hypothetical protein